MTERSTTKITTPVTNTEVELFEWITGKQREYIDEPSLSSMRMRKGQDSEAEMESDDIGAVILESRHRQLKSFVKSVAGKEDDVVEAILALPEKDAQFVKEEVRGLSEAGQADDN